MIKIAIDVNDVIRAFTKQYALIYQKNNTINLNFDINNLNYTDNNIYSPFKFDKKEQKEVFQYIDYPFEIYGSAKCVDKNIPGELNIWKNDIDDLEKEEDVEITIVCCDENELSIQATLFFLAKNCCRIRNILFPISSDEVLKNFDIIVTADTRIIKNIDLYQDKTIIKIDTEYNKDMISTNNNNNIINYKSFLNFIEDKKTWFKLLKIIE